MVNVSVILPVYNRSSELLRALDSVYAQHSQANEVIVVDDGSDIELKSVVNNHNPQTKYIKQAHSGVSCARNNGVKHSNNEWIAFLDSDDEWHPQKLKQQRQRLSQTDVLIGHTDEIWIRKGVRVNPHKKHKKYGGNIFSRCLPLCLISPSSVVISKALFLKEGGFDESLPACEDYDLWLRITSKLTIDYIDNPLVIKHGGHADQLSQKYWGMDRFRIQAMEKLYRSGALSNSQAIELLEELIKKCTIFANGSVKHNKPLQYAEYSEKSSQYKNKLTALVS